MNVYIFRGKSATGKTTLTNFLSRKLNIPVLRKDDIFDPMSKYVHDNNSLNGASYDVLANMLQTYIDNGTDVIVDVALPDKKAFDVFLGKVSFRNATVHKFLCACSDEGVWLERWEKRLEKPLPNQYFHSIDEIRVHYEKMEIAPSEDEVVLDSIVPVKKLADIVMGKFSPKKTLLFIFELLWKIATIIFACVGVYLQARDDGGLFRHYTYLYFTVISNSGTAIIFSIFVILRIVECIKGKQLIPKSLFTLKFMFTAAMTLTLTVAAILLAPFKDNAYLFSMKNLSLHIITPLLMALDFLMFDTRFEYKWKTAFLGFVLPLLYLVITLLISIKGITYSNGTNFPYYFLDYRTLGWFRLSGGMPGVAWWIMIIGAMTFVVSFILVLLKKIIHK